MTDLSISQARIQSLEDQIAEMEWRTKTNYPIRIRPNQVTLHGGSWSLEMVEELKQIARKM